MENQKKHKRKKIFLRILNYASRYKLLVLFSAILSAVTVILTLYVPILIGQAVDKIVGVEKVEFLGLLGILKTILIVTLISAAAQWIRTYLNQKISYQVAKDIRGKAFYRIQDLPLGYLDGHPSGDIVSRIVTDTDQFSEGLLMGATQFFSGIMTIVGTLIFMLWIHPLITAVVVVLTPLSFFVAKFIARKSFTMFQLQSSTRGELTAFTDEMLENLKVVKAFGREENTLEDFDKINDKLSGYSEKATFYSSLVNPSTRFVNSVVYAAVGFLGAYMALKGMITVGQLTSFLNYAGQYTKPFNEISGVITELQNSIASAERVFALIDEEVIPEDPEDAVELVSTEGKVDLEQVDFSYKKDQPLITNFQLNVKPGQRVAIVGPTGSGKTTIINLLMRFYDIDKGSIRFDGVDSKRIKTKSLREQIGMVLQDTWLRKGTIAENIAFGKPQATREEIEAAAKEAYCHGFIMQLPKGYDTVITEEGGVLSEGQKQLLCIARVMLCLPSILILDEATSSIDTRTELKIQKTFDKLMEGRTSFVVAHRLSTVREADVILVMKDGAVIEQGTHEELMEKKGFYAKAVKSGLK